MLRTAFLAAVTLAFVNPAQALTCREVQGYVAQYGEWAVSYWARNNGYSEAMIVEIKRKCLTVATKKSS